MSKMNQNGPRKAWSRKCFATGGARGAKSAIFFAKISIKVRNEQELTKSAKINEKC